MKRSPASIAAAGTGTTQAVAMLAGAAVGAVGAVGLHGCEDPHRDEKQHGQANHQKRLAAFLRGLFPGR